MIECPLANLLLDHANRPRHGVWDGKVSGRGLQGLSINAKRGMTDVTELLGSLELCAEDVAEFALTDFGRCSHHTDSQAFRNQTEFLWFINDRGDN